MVRPTLKNSVSTGVGVVDQSAWSKRSRLRRQTYFAQFISYLVDVAIIYFYSLNGVTSADSALLYLAATGGWTATTLFLSEIHFQ
ncbi:hypothetical protein [Bradyrhizobium sp. 76]|uniref:hypothetical protein n=1 Tax=Bradyrhizobium sp. 76 TaxID=2782680 RepID=UPI001FF7C8AE|nr:hypothetical protein [Bradyrhizobium sp. 76]MCK1405107.1 hypothetical protein [Bradyrhizobium sp. 76]